MFNQAKRLGFLMFSLLTKQHKYYILKVLKVVKAMLLNIFSEAYNVCVRGIPNYWQLIIALVSMLACIFFVLKIIKKSSDKHPINFGYLFLAVLFGAISILYTF